MRKSILSLALVSVLAANAVAPKKAPTSLFSIPQTESKSFSLAKAQGQFDPSSSWGIINTPLGEEWFYTADYSYDNSGYSISAVKFSIFNAKMEFYASFDAEFELGENETSINYVQLVPTITKKFFNYDDAYEVMVFVHATTKDYNGHYYTVAYSLKDGSKIYTLEGNNIAAVNTAPDEWSEKYTMAFTRECYDNGYEVFVDVYSKPNWGEEGPQLLHTFPIDIERFQGAGGSALYFLMGARNGKDLFYAIPYYEKTYWTNPNDYYDESINEDNNFIIDLYDSNFSLVRTTSIPMSTQEGATFSFPGLGLLMNNSDMDFTYFSDGEYPAYIVGIENYINSKDDYVKDFYVYDVDGNLLNTIAENADFRMLLCDITGQDRQYCFYISNENESYFKMVDIPSCLERAHIDTTLDTGESITSSLDRTAVGNSYMYVSSFSMADVDAQDNAIHKIAWFNNKGQLDHITAINLGQNISLAMPYISGRAFDPYIFNTDSDIEYMFLVKQLRDNMGSSADTYLRIYGENNNMLFDLGPDLDNGGSLSSVFLQNLGTTDAKLVVTYNSNEGYITKYYDLPLNKYAGGEGTPENPYLVSTTGDIMALATEPNANYKLINDIDFAGNDFITNACDFTGSLDGAGFSISNANFNKGGIFEMLVAGASVQNLSLVNCSLYSDYDAGFIANSAYGYAAANHPIISNVRLLNCDIIGGDAYYGGIVGTSYLYSTMSECAAENLTIICKGIAGGIVGRLQTSSKVESCAVNAFIVANIGGGIAGDSHTGDELIKNCHFSGVMNTEIAAGGIIGLSGRAIITNCYAQGEFGANSEQGAYVGGIIGQLECTYDEVPAIIVHDNVVGPCVFVLPSQCEDMNIHRIAGRTASDEFEYDYDDNGQPYVVGYKDPERGLNNNYAYDTPIVDETADDALNSVEGLTIGAISQEFFESIGFAFGNTAASPWVSKDGIYYLYFETVYPEKAGINSIVSDKKSGILSLQDSNLIGQGEINVFTLGGIKIASNIGQVSLATLPTGIYIATCQGQTLKFIKK